jgi:hypothetical protein
VIQGRAKSIVQNSKIKSKNNRIASFFFLKNKNLFDFKLNLDVYTNSNKPAGVVFRMKDAYNFYAIEFNQKKGYKKLFKSVDGVYTQLGFISDGGLSQNQWYKLQIVAEKERITIKIGSDVTFGKYSSLPVIFSKFDGEIKSGTVGLFVNGNEKFYFDSLTLKANPCWTPWKPSKKVSVIPNRANLYEENYKQELKQK